MHCSACGWDNPPSARFCGHCGVGLTNLTQSAAPGSPTSSATLADLTALTARLMDLTSESLGNPKTEEGSAESYLRAQLLRLVLHFAALDGNISRGEAQVYSEISNCIDSQSSRKYGGDLEQTDIDVSTAFLTGLMHAAPSPLERPLALDFIEEHDRANSTNNAQEARNIFFHIATAVVSSDGPPSSNETAELGRYKKILEQPASPLENKRSETSKHLIRTPERTIEAGPTELESLAAQFQSCANSLPPPEAEEFRANLPVDALTLASAFSKAAGSVSDGTAEFVLCIIDGVSSVRALPEVLQDTVLDVKKTIRDNWETVPADPKVPVTIAGLLSHDQDFITKYFETAWKLFGQLVDCLAAEDCKESPATKLLRDAYKSFLGFHSEIPTPTQRPSPTADQSMTAKSDNLRSLAQEFVSFCKLVAPKVNEMLKSATVLGPDGRPSDSTDFAGNLSIDGLFLSATVSKASGGVSDAIAEFLLLLMSGLADKQVHAPFPPEILASTKSTIQSEWTKVPAKPVEPMTVTALAVYDQNFGTQYCGTARGLFCRLVSELAQEAGASEDAMRSLVEQWGAVLSAGVEDIPEAVNKSTSGRPSGVPCDTFDSLMAELQALIGLAKVKKDVAELANYIKVQQLRKSRGLKTPELSLHMVFYGNPGTGKTTVARLLARIYRSLGVVTQGQLVETDRSGLVAGYVGQTALKVKEVVNRALGGILFIDEAYALKPKNDSSDFGDEAIETLLKLMEDNRGNLIVIVAGYPDEMRYFLDSNPGLESRFNKYLTFDDYTPDELLTIFERFCNESQYRLDDESTSKLRALFELAFEHRDGHFGNARLARNAFEQAITNMASRVVNLPRIEDSALETIQVSDVPDVLTAGPTRGGLPA